MARFEIHFNFFIVLPIRLKAGRYNGFCFVQGKVCAICPGLTSTAGKQGKECYI